MNRIKLLKILGVATGAIVAVIISLSILLNLLVTPELVKKSVLPPLSKAINRQVTLGDVSVSIFSGIRLKDIVVMDREGTEPFLTAGALRLNYRLWPLLLKRVDIKEAKLESPRIRIVQYADNSFNFSDLTAKKEKAATPAEPKAKTPINLAVSEVALSDGKLIFESRRGIENRPFTTEIKDINIAAKRISLDGEFPLSFRATLPGNATVSLEGTASRVAVSPAIATEFTFIAKDLSGLVAGLPPALNEKLKKLNVSGGVEIRLRLAGDTKKPRELLQDAEISLTSLQATAGGLRPSISGMIKLGKDSLESKDLGITVGGQKLAIGLKAGNLQGKPVNLTLAIHGDKLDLNPIMPAKPQAASAPPQPPAADKDEPGPMNIPVTASGTINIKNLVYRTLNISDLSVGWRLADNIFTLDSLKGGLSGGTFSKTAKVNLGVKGFAYSANISAKGVQADPMVTAFAPKATGTVFGTMGFNAQLQGSGTKPDAIKRNLAGNGDFAITDGKLTGNGFMQGLAAFLKADQLRILRFSKYSGTFVISKGIVNLNSELNGSDARIKTAGTAGFDKSINMSLDTRLSPAITGQLTKGEFGRFMSDSQGWGMLPLKVSGTVASPSFSIDPKLAAANLKGKLADQLQQQLFKGKEDQGGKTPKGAQKTEKNLLDQGLKGIFGK